MADISKEELLKFLDKVDVIADEMENHPQLSNYLYWYNCSNKEC
jgi:hypothetical protein